MTTCELSCLKRNKGANVLKGSVIRVQLQMSGHAAKVCVHQVVSLLASSHDLLYYRLVSR